MRREGLIGGRVVVACVIAVLIVGALTPARRTFTTAVPLDQPMAEVRGGGQVCQTPVDVPPDAGFRTVGAYLNPALKGARPRDPIAVTVRRGAGNRAVARGTIDAGWSPYPAQTRVRLDRSVPGDGPVSVCLASRGRRPFYVWGSPTPTYRVTPATLGNGKLAGGQLRLDFYRDAGSRLSELPVAFQRMTLFRPAWLGPWFAWLVFAVVVVGAPLGLAWALVRASR